MQIKTGFLSLLFLVPLALGSPIQTCANELQAFQSQVSPVDASTMKALDDSHITTPSNVFWVRCDGRARKCFAQVKGYRGRRWRATWRLRSYRRRGRFEEVEGFDDDLDFYTLPPLLNLRSISCDPQRRLCSGRMQRGGAVATWSAVKQTRRWLSPPTSDGVAEGDVDDEVEFQDNTEGEDFLDSEELFEEGLEGDNENDDYESGDTLLLDADPFRPIGIRNGGLECNRRRKQCRAQLLRRGFAMQWNIRVN
ncbi:hypothetical protein D9619_010869 [Psilocybe cf. subviscida]|uniref:Uncharacterized protein n=1 Tax=Psilocybe cf. subviscida TaxID=2480587 RepID=A0A8H5EZX9_9AGAR|nr:hypothetical protein D9619_010869 [Psilocybe cf. subviscida]